MAFSKLKYESDTLGLIIGCKISEEEEAVAGAEPAGDQDAGLTALSSGSKRRFGIHARHLIVTRTSGTAPDLVTRSRRVTMLTVAAYNAVAVNSSLTIGGIAWNVFDKVPEKAK